MLSQSEAVLVYGNYIGGPLKIPPAMGEPRGDQLQGTPLEQLGELACRVCYDSLGSERSRSSTDLHKHIIEAVNTSVYEHCVMTVDFNNAVSNPAWLAAMIGRPGLSVVCGHVSSEVQRITFNARTILDWDKHHNVVSGTRPTAALALKRQLQYWAHKCMPHVIPPADIDTNLIVSQLARPAHETERWATFWLKCSRGCSHELVRHGDFTAISQRSTRYVNEAESDFCVHPLIRAFIDEAPTPHTWLDDRVATSVLGDRGAYIFWVQMLEPWLLAKGHDAHTARKQARGAARGFLGNALETQLIFSASIAQWKNIIKQRVNAAADAEINNLISQVADALFV